MRHSKVFTFDQRISEEAMVMRPGFRVNREKEKSARVPVEPVHWCKTGKPCASL
jgi:hypothetical protein